MIKSSFGKSIMVLIFFKKKKWNCDLNSVLKRHVLSAHYVKKKKKKVFGSIFLKPKTHNWVFGI